MASETASGSLPALAYVYDPLSFAPLSITEAAQGICRLVWVVDFSKPGAAGMARLLRKFGPVIDTAGRPLAAVAAEVQAHAPSGVLSMHDADLLWTAQLAELLGLRFHSVGTAQKLIDKHAQREALAAAGLPVPPFVVIPADADTAAVAAIASDFSYPAVLKPRQGQSSRDTLPVDSGADLELLINDLRSRSELPAEDFVLEGFIPDPSIDLGGQGFAPFVSVESVVEAGQVEHASISSRTPFLWPFRETGYCTPTAISAGLERELYRVAGEAALALGVTHSCLHTEIKLTDNGPVVIEVNGRPGGGMSEMLQRASAGFSILRSALKLAVGQPVGLRGPVHCDRVGYLLYVFPQDDSEWIDQVEGLSELHAMDGVDEVVLVRGPGQRIDWREGSEAHVCHVTGTTRDHDDLLTLIEAITTVVRITGHTGQPVPTVGSVDRVR